MYGINFDFRALLLQQRLNDFVFRPDPTGTAYLEEIIGDYLVQEASGRPVPGLQQSTLEFLYDGQFFVLHDGSLCR